MWSLIILVFATSNVACATVTTLEFSTEQLCQMAVRELDNLTSLSLRKAPLDTKSLGLAFIPVTLNRVTFEPLRRLAA
jgi:hypothetical protein